MTLATADRQARPSARTVLLKAHGAEGFIFFTNLQSRKARELAANPFATLSFYWEPLRKQVLVEGPVERVSDAEADAYWATRDRTSQLGAWASRQSETLDSWRTMISRLAHYRRQFAGGPIPRPAHWSGFRLIPSRIEFWSARPFRLNERIVYERVRGRWSKGLLYP